MMLDVIRIRRAMVFAFSLVVAACGAPPAVNDAAENEVAELDVANVDDVSEPEPIDVAVRDVARDRFVPPDVRIDAPIDVARDATTESSLPDVTDARDTATTDTSAPCALATPLRCGTACVDPRVDPDHCGTCEHVCAGVHVCTAGACIVPTQIAAGSEHTCARLSDGTVR
jgi:hypothetical protein